MKRFLSLLSVAAIASQSLATMSFAAEAVDTDHLEVTAVSSTKVGEAIDLTVKAVAKDGSVVPTYAGTVFVIVDNDNKATVPYAEGYTFTAADQGKKTFSKGLSFTKEGTFKVTVSDFDKPKIEGTVKVAVTGGGNSTGATGSELVTITSPDKGSTLGGKDLSITGTTKKNSKVQLFLNGSKALESQTDDKGTFLFQVKDVDQVDNIFSVKVLDGSDKVIGESEKINVKVGSEGPAFKSLTFSGGTTVQAGAVLEATVVADAGLKEVSLSIGDSTEMLKETATGGTYMGSITVPSAAGSGTVDVTLKNDLGKSTVKKAAATLTITEAPKPAFKNIKVETTDKKATFTFELENDTADIKKFEFTYSTGGVSVSAPGANVSSGTGTEKKVITYDKEKIKNGSGAYTWYISGLEIAKYTVTIAGVGADGKTLSGVVSDAIEADLSLGAAGKCTIANVSGLKTTVSKDSTILSWDTIPEAVSYKVYKKDKDGKFVFIEETKTPTYTIHVSSGPVKYEEFSVKAVCADKTESAAFSPTTKVKTGPAELFLLAMLATGIAYAIIRRKRAF